MPASMGIQWYWWLVAGFICVFYAIDMGYMRFWTLRSKRYRAVWMSILLVLPAILWGFLLLNIRPHEQVGGFFAAFLGEKTLTFGNAFIIFLTFWSLEISPQMQRRLLGIAIAFSLVSRSVFVIAGYALAQIAPWVAALAGALSVVMAVQLLARSDRKTDVTHHWAVRLIGKIWTFRLETPTPLFVFEIEGRRQGTKNLLALLVILFTSAVFGLLSAPIAFATVPDMGTALAATLLGLLGTRPAFFLIYYWNHRLKFLKPGMAIILAYLGVAAVRGPDERIPSWVSLGVLCLVYLTTALSVWVQGKSQPTPVTRR